MNNPMRYVDPDGRQVGVPPPFPVPIPPIPAPIPLSTEKSITEQYHEVGQAMVDVATGLSKFTDSNSKIVAAVIVVGGVKVLNDLGVIEASGVEHNQLEEQRRRQRRSDQEDLKNKETTDKISNGSHNPKTPDGDFRPNIDPDKVKTAVKVIAVGTAAGVGISQIGGENDVRKDIKEQNKSGKNESDNYKPTGNIIIDVLYKLFVGP